MKHATYLPQVKVVHAVHGVRARGYSGRRGRTVRLSRDPLSASADEGALARTDTRAETALAPNTGIAIVAIVRGLSWNERNPGRLAFLPKNAQKMRDGDRPRGIHRGRHCVVLVPKLQSQGDSA